MPGRCCATLACTALAYKLGVERMQARQICLEDVVERAFRVIFASTVTDAPSMLHHADRRILKLHSHAQNLDPLTVLVYMLLHGLDQ